MSSPENYSFAKALDASESNATGQEPNTMLAEYLQPAERTGTAFSAPLTAAAGLATPDTSTGTGSYDGQGSPLSTARGFGDYTPQSSAGVGNNYGGNNYYEGSQVGQNSNTAGEQGAYPWRASPYSSGVAPLALEATSPYGPGGAFQPQAPFNPGSIYEQPQYPQGQGFPPGYQPGYQQGFPQGYPQGNSQMPTDGRAGMGNNPTAPGMPNGAPNEGGMSQPGTTPNGAGDQVPTPNETNSTPASDDSSGSNASQKTWMNGLGGRLLTGTSAFAAPRLMDEKIPEWLNNRKAGNQNAAGAAISETEAPKTTIPDATKAATTAEATAAEATAGSRAATAKEMGLKYGGMAQEKFGPEFTKFKEAHSTYAGKGIGGGFIANLALDNTLLKGRETTWKTVGTDVAAPFLANLVAKKYGAWGAAATMISSHLIAKEMLENKKSEE